MCKRPIGAISWHDAPPAVLKDDGTTAEWKDVALQHLEKIFRTSKPLCWYCNNVAELSRLDPSRITTRRIPAEPRKPPLKSDNLY